MAGTILNVTTTPQTLTILKAKTVAGKFGLQLWCAVSDAQGEEHTLYLPWANSNGSMSGVFQQFVRTGAVGPEDFQNAPDVWYDQFEGKTYTFEKVFKAGKQLINVNAASPVLAAAVKELGLDPHPVPVAAPARATAPAQPAAPATQRATVESINALYDKAVAHALNVTAQIAEQGFEVSGETVHAMAATLVIAYQKEGVK